MKEQVGEYIIVEKMHAGAIVESHVNARYGNWQHRGRSATKQLFCWSQQLYL